MSDDYVKESPFGIWFLGTETWRIHVLNRAMKDLERMIGPRRPHAPVILDVGCGFGNSLKLLHERFQPSRLIGIDVDPHMITASGEKTKQSGITAELHQAKCSKIPLEDGCVDILFCHQTFHHLVEQDESLREFHRVLKPGGLLLFAESTREYIHSWIIRLLFRHPMEMQRTSDEYRAMVEGARFQVDAESISFPYLWWSRADLGIAERWFGRAPAKDHEETLVNMVAVRL